MSAYIHLVYFMDTLDVAMDREMTRDYDINT